MEFKIRFRINDAFQYSDEMARYYLGAFLKNDNIPKMLWTGIKDKTGREIYAEDIVKWKDERFRIYMEKGHIKGEALPGHQSHNVYLYDDALEESKVVGNKFDNPEMLKDS